eukprot:TRINITY_DN1407_c0_g1_i2.p1 TRINITY_DN1407_c0_g1~~TRINITY_DN1407_c0_g1_i2.p1  ORF type:complete len:181 (+),score=20.82 TRINITY_DN1407_c0_g1_i2:474-1016(+)
MPGVRGSAGGLVEKPHFKYLSKRRRQEEVDQRIRCLFNILPNADKSDPLSVVEAAITYTRSLERQLGLPVSPDPTFASTSIPIVTEEANGEETPGCAESSFSVTDYSSDGTEDSSSSGEASPSDLNSPESLHNGAESPNGGAESPDTGEEFQNTISSAESLGDREESRSNSANYPIGGGN